MSKTICIGKSDLTWPSIEAWNYTGALRWLQVPHTTTQPPKLQQEAIERYSGRREWIDVPLVVEAASLPAEPAAEPRPPFSDEEG